MTRVRIDRLSLAYDRDVPTVDDVSLTIEDGEMACLLGPSGCGKTTLLRLVGGLLRPESGDVWFDDARMTDVAASRRNVGFVFQDHALFPHLRVRENVSFGLEARGWSKDRSRERVEEMLDLVELHGKERRFPNQLSGGERQRVAIARALATDPAVLLFDEPLSALDRKLRDVLKFTVQALQRASGKTAIYVTHDQSEAFAIADRVAVMHEGRILQVGSPTDVYLRPEAHFVADFVGISNRLPATVLDGGEAGGAVRVRVGQAVLSAYGAAHTVPGEAVMLHVRPERVTLVPNAADGPGDLLTGVVERTIFEGPTLQVWLAVEGARLIAEVPGVEELDLRPGMTVGARINHTTVLAADAP